MNISFLFKKTKNILVKFDYLKQPLNFKVKAKEKGTPFGGFIFLIIIACSVLYFIMIYTDLKNEDTMNLQDTKKIYQIQNKQISKDEFQVGIMVSKDLLVGEQALSEEIINQYISINMFEYQIYQNQTNNTTEVTKNIIRLQPCQQNFEKIDQFIDIQMNNAIIFCPEDNFQIQKSNQQQFQQILRLEVNIKQQQVKLMNSSVTGQNLNNLILKILYFDEDNYVSKKDKIVKQVINCIDFPINSQTKDSIKVEISPFSTFLQNSQMLNILNQQNSDTDLHPILNGVKLQIKQQLKFLASEDETNPNLAINFINSERKWINVLQNTNKYLEILTLLSQVSALFSMIYFSVKFLYKFYYYHIAYEELMNETFNFDVSEGRIDGSQYLKKEKPKNPLYNIFSYKVNYFYYQYLLLRLKKRIYLCLCRKKMRINKGIQLFQKAKSKIQQDLDLTHLLKKLYEIDKLKLLLLNENQLILFNSLIDPIIEVQEELKKSVSLQQSQSPFMHNYNANNGGQINQPPSISNQSIALKQKQKNQKRKSQPRFSNISTNSIVIKKLDEQQENTICFKSNFFKSQLQKITMYDIFTTYQNIVSEIEFNKNSKTSVSDQQQFTNIINEKLLQLLKLNQNLNKNIEYHKQLYQNQALSQQLCKVDIHATPYTDKEPEKIDLLFNVQLQKQRSNKSIFCQNFSSNQNIINFDIPNLKKANISVKFNKSSNHIQLPNIISQINEHTATEPDAGQDEKLSRKKEFYDDQQLDSQEKSCFQIPSEGIEDKPDQIYIQKSIKNMFGLHKH